MPQAKRKRRTQDKYTRPAPPIRGGLPGPTPTPLTDEEYLARARAADPNSVVREGELQPPSMDPHSVVRENEILMLGRPDLEVRPPTSVERASTGTADFVGGLLRDMVYGPPATRVRNEFDREEIRRHQAAKPRGQDIDLPAEKKKKR